MHRDKTRVFHAVSTDLPHLQLYTGRYDVYRWHRTEHKIVRYDISASAPTFRIRICSFYPVVGRQDNRPARRIRVKQFPSAQGHMTGARLRPA